MTVFEEVISALADVEARLTISARDRVVEEIAIVLSPPMFHAFACSMPQGERVKRTPDRIEFTAGPYVVVRGDGR